jgi:hypothetical protein
MEYSRRVITFLSARVIDDDKIEPLILYLSRERFGEQDRASVPTTNSPDRGIFQRPFLFVSVVITSTINYSLQRRRYQVPLNKHYIFLDIGSDSESTSLVHKFSY